MILPSVSTVNSIASAISKPSGACVSVSVYLPGASSTSFSVVVDTQVSTSSSSSSVMVKVAPGSSEVPLIIVLDIFTG